MMATATSNNHSTEGKIQDDLAKLEADPRWVKTTSGSHWFPPETN